MRVRHSLPFQVVGGGVSLKWNGLRPTTLERLREVKGVKRAVEQWRRLCEIGMNSLRCHNRTMPIVRQNNMFAKVFEGIL